MSVRKDAYTWLGVGAIAIAIVGSALFFIFSYQSTATVRLGDGVFRARVASSDLQRAKGLSGVTELPQNEAMLFVYDTDQANQIWMKDMKMRIDAVWLSSDRKVVHTEKALSPDNYPEKYGPKSQTRYVIELPEGAVDRARIKVGMQAIIEGHKVIE